MSAPIAPNHVEGRAERRRMGPRLPRMAPRLPRMAHRLSRMGLRAPFGLRRALGAMLLPVSLIPVLALAPSLARAPATLWRRTERALAPAHAKVHHREPSGPKYFLVGPARLELNVLTPVAGVLTPQLGVSPLAEPAWAELVDGPPRPVVFIARARPVTLSTQGVEGQ
jgi:hypothetical protein